MPGRFYVMDACLACETCQSVAPNNFRYGKNGLSYVFRQPSDPIEVMGCEEAVAGCPMEAVRSDGAFKIRRLEFFRQIWRLWQRLR
jgi:ferredoxin